MNSLQQQIARVQSQLRRWAVFRGVTLTVAAAWLTLLCLSVGDWLLHLDSNLVRTGLLLGTIALVGGLVWRLVIQPRRERVDEVELAILLDEAGSRRDDLASAVEFSQLPDRSPTRLEQDLVDRVVDRLRLVPLADVIRRSALVVPLVVLAAIAGTTALLVGLSPGAARVAALRTLTPWSDVEWPRRNTLRFLNSSLEPLESGAGLRVAQGEPLALYVEDVNGRMPSSVHLDVTRPDLPMESQELRQTSLRSGSELHEVAVISLSPGAGPLELKVSGGDDDRLPPLRIDVAPPPLVESFQITVTPPAYTGQPQETLSGTVGHVQGVVGTQVEVAATSNVPLSEAVLHRGPKVREVLRLSEDHKSLSASWTIGEADRSSYWFELKDEHGMGNANPPRYEIRGIADRDPTVRIEQPENDLKVTPTAVVPFVIQASDDLGLRSVGLVVELVTGGAPETVSPLQSYEDSPRETRIEHPLQIAELNPQPGAQYRIRAEARDRFDLDGRMGHAARSAPRVLTVVGMEEKRTELASRQSSIAEALQRSLDGQSGTRSQLSELEIQLKKAGALKPEDHAAIQRAEASQEQVRDEISNSRRGAAAQIAELRREAAWNQLDDDAFRSRWGGVQEELKELSEETLPRLAATLGRFRRESEDQAAEAGKMAKTLGEALAMQDQVQQRLSETLSDLAEWTKRQNASQQVADLLAAQEAVAKETLELGAKTLSMKPSELSAQQQADLARLADRQGRLAKEVGELAAQGAQSDQPDSKGEETSPAMSPEEGSRAAGQMQRAADLLEENLVQQAAELQKELINELRKLDAKLKGYEPQSEETLLKQIADARREAAGLRDQQAAIRSDLQSVTPNTADPQQQELLETLEKRQEELQRQAEEFSQRLRKNRMEKPAASARRSAGRMASAGDALENENIPESLAQQSEALDDLLQAERELAEQERKVKRQSALQELANLGAKVKGLAERQAGLIEEVQRLKAVQDESGRLARSQLRTLQQTAKAQAGLAEETASLAEELKTHPVLQLAAETAKQAMAAAAQGLEKPPLQETPLVSQQEAHRQLDELAKSMAGSGEGMASHGPQKQGEGGEPSEPDAASTALLAEIRLLKSMQEQVQKRTTELAAMAAGAETLPPEIKDEVMRLSERQTRLAELAEALIQQGKEESP
jgi:hypothetical protein